MPNARLSQKAKEPQTRKTSKRNDKNKQGASLKPNEHLGQSHEKLVVGAVR